MTDETDDKVPGEDDKKNIASGCSAYIGKHITDVVKALTDVAQDVKCLAEVNDALKTEMDMSCVSKCEVDKIRLENEALRREFEQLKGLKDHVESLCRENSRINNNLTCNSAITGPPQEDPVQRMEELKDVVLGIKYDGNPCEMLERASRDNNSVQGTAMQSYDMNQFDCCEDPCGDCIYCCKVPNASLQRTTDSGYLYPQGRSEYANRNQDRESVSAFGQNKLNSAPTRNCTVPQCGGQFAGNAGTANYAENQYDALTMDTGAKNANGNRDPHNTSGSSAAYDEFMHPWRRDLGKNPTIQQIQNINCPDSCRKHIGRYCGSACQKPLPMSMHMARQNAKVQQVEDDNDNYKKNAETPFGHACQKHMEMAMNMARQNAKVEPCADHLAKVYSNSELDRNDKQMERQNSKVEELKKHLDNGYSRNFNQNKAQVYNNNSFPVNQQLLEIQNYANNLKATDAAKIGRELSKVVKCVKKLQKNNLTN